MKNRKCHVPIVPAPHVKDAIAVLEPLRNITLPDGDNAGEPLNSPSVYDGLSREDQEKVDDAEEVVSTYLRQAGDRGDEPNKRAITQLKKKGYETFLQVDQYDPDRLVGRVSIGDNALDVSDPPPPNYD
ncbi:hypothetical protein PO002_11040 [Cupriavidus necator]|uniref:hypothetical protein n=1 Tax=Cupriavidus necator TaxID=106590 RepID=UPI0039C2AB78